MRKIKKQSLEDQIENALKLSPEYGYQNEYIRLLYWQKTKARVPEILFVLVAIENLLFAVYYFFRK